MKVKALAVVFLLFASLAQAESPLPPLPDDARFAPPDSNDQTPSGHNALRKLGRGFSNLLFGITEIPNQITKTTAEKGGAAGVTYGFGKGLVRWLCREVVGVYEIITFPIPAPRYYKPVMRPEFPNEDYEP